MFKHLTPNLMVRSVKETIQYYETYLDFSLLMTVPEHGRFVWAMMERDSVQLMFQDENNLIGEYPNLAERTKAGGLTLFFDIDNVEKLYNQIFGKVDIVKELHQTFYGTIEFALQDLNGFTLTFAEKRTA